MRGNGFTPKVIWSIVKEAAAKSGLSGLAPHHLRRTCHQAGGELEQIQFPLGHVSSETTERYLGCKQRSRNAVNDKIDLEPGWLVMAEISSKSQLSDTKLVALPEVDYISLIWSRRPNRMDYSSDENCI